MNAADNAQQNAVEIQRAYYARTAQHYDEVHLHEHSEHEFAMRFMIAAIEYFGITSVLDIGSGTGRCVLNLAKELPGVTVVGVEPSPELREIGYSKGLSKTQLIDGDAMALAFEDGAFDLVCEFGALHHIPDPAQAVSEMLRVSRKAIFISDSNNFGQGGKLSRLFKQTLNAARLWPLMVYIKTGGKGYSVTEGDGLGYSYSVFNSYKQIKTACESVHMLNTTDGAPNLYRSATHAALLGIKHPAKSNST